MHREQKERQRPAPPNSEWGMWNSEFGDKQYEPRRRQDRKGKSFPYEGGKLFIIYSDAVAFRKFASGEFTL
jgi:hypothetical protein